MTQPEFHQWLEHCRRVVFLSLRNRQLQNGAGIEKAVYLAEDAVSFAVQQLLAQPNKETQFPTVNHLCRWMRTVAARYLVDQHRTDKGVRLRADFQSLGSLPRRDRIPIVRKCWGQLSEREQQLLSLKYDEELTDNEIADRIDPQPTKSLSARAQAVRKERIAAERKLRILLDKQELDV
jgi:DNA-directed RNA polymerase specialized sigma24 family protein